MILVLRKFVNLWMVLLTLYLMIMQIYEVNVYIGVKIFHLVSLVMFSDAHDINNL